MIHVCEIPVYYFLEGLLRHSTLFSLVFSYSSIKIQVGKWHVGGAVIEVSLKAVYIPSLSLIIWRKIEYLASKSSNLMNWPRGFVFDAHLKGFRLNELSYLLIEVTFISQRYRSFNFPFAFWARPSTPKTCNMRTAKKFHWIFECNPTILGLVWSFWTYRRYWNYPLIAFDKSIKNL